MASPGRKPENPASAGPRRTSVVVFPFDIFGGSGAGAGAELIADELREIVADNRREEVPTRADVYTRKFRIKEYSFDSLASLNAWRTTGRQAARPLLDGAPQDFFLWLGGSHISSLPVYEEAIRQPGTIILQLDAHLDIHHFASCNPLPTHGNFIRHIERPDGHSENEPFPIVHLGHRDLLLPQEEIGRFYRRAHSGIEFAQRREGVLAEIEGSLAGADRILLDIDCDVFDPAFFPATGRPVPAGLSPLDVLRVLGCIPLEKLAGVVLSEFDPGRDQTDRSLGLIVWLLEATLLARHELRWHTH